MFEPTLTSYNINETFLVLSLFFPRISLLLAYWGNIGGIPFHHNIPHILNVLGAIFLPRVLICLYIYQNYGYDNVWFIAHAVCAVIAYLGGTKTYYRDKD